MDAHSGNRSSVVTRVASLHCWPSRGVRSVIFTRRLPAGSLSSLFMSPANWFNISSLMKFLLYELRPSIDPEFEPFIGHFPSDSKEFMRLGDDYVQPNFVYFASFAANHPNPNLFRLFCAPCALCG